MIDDAFHKNPGILEGILRKLRTSLNSFELLQELMHNPTNDDVMMGINLARSTIHETKQYFEQIYNLYLSLGKKHQGFEFFDLKECINGVVVFYQNKAQAKNIEITLDYTFENLSIEFSPVDLEIILQHILQNAIDMSEDSSIEVSVSFDYILCVTVKETCSHLEIELDTAQIINSAEDYIPVSGSSLKTAAILSHKYNGSLSLLPIKPKGKITELRIPVKKITRKNEAAKKSSEHVLRQHPVNTILLIEDEYLNLLYAKSIIEKSGKTVFTANTGHKGIELFEEHNPDTIILDIGLPDISGLVLLDELSKRCDLQKKNVVITTAFNDHITLELLEKHPISHIIMKPYKGSELTTAIQ